MKQEKRLMTADAMTSGYESPCTYCTAVQAESAFCATSGNEVKDKNSVELDANSHVAGSTIDASDDAWQ